MALSDITRLKNQARTLNVFWGGSDADGPYNSGIGTTVGSTYCMANPDNRIRQDGPIRQVHFPVLSNGGDPSNSFKLKVFRPPSFDLIAETPLISIGPGVGQRHFQLPVPLEGAEIGDIPALYIPGGTGAKAWTVAVIDNTTRALGWNVKFIRKEAVSGDAWSDYANCIIPLWVSGAAAITAVVGDSIPEGHPKFHGCLHRGVGISGDRANDVFYHVRNLIPNFDYQNWGLGGSTWATVRSNLPEILACRPRSFFFYCGVNGIVQNRSWELEQADIYACLDLLPAGIPVFLSEMLPYSGPSDATDAVAEEIRSRNAKYASICDLNGITLVRCWEQMGQLRPSTNQKDDLITAYNVGDGHLTSDAGAPALASIYATAILSGL